VKSSELRAVKAKYELCTALTCLLPDFEVSAANERKSALDNSVILACLTGHAGVKLINQNNPIIIMKQEFITINNTIQDYDEYVKNIILLKNYLKNKVKEFLFSENFILINNKNITYHNSVLTFYSQEKDLEVEINIKKKNNEVFV